MVINAVSDSNLMYCIRIFPNKLLKLTQKIPKFLEQPGRHFLYFTRFSSQNKISSEDILPGLCVSGCGASFCVIISVICIQLRPVNIL